MNIIEIPLTQGMVATIDEDDYELVSKYRWFADNSCKTYYARANTRNKYTGKRGHISMHRLILGFPDKKVDHKDGNGLNNTRGNLRLANDSENAWNRSVREIDRASRYKGVSYIKRNGNWSAGICVNGTELSVSGFKKDIDAAIAYDSMARHYYGRFAKTNFDGNASRSHEEVKNERLLSAKIGKSSVFHGVHYSNRCKKWIVQIHEDGKQREIGRFDSETDAALAYNKAAERIRKAILNDIGNGGPVFRSAQ